MTPFTTRPTIMGTRGVVAAGHYLAASIGFIVLERGGNAVDAGVAAGFAVNVLKPHQNGIAGEAPMLVAPAGANGDRVFAISGQGTAPRRATIEWFRENGVDVIPGDGLLPITVPAAFGAWCTALARFGTRSLKDVLGPAIELAESGFAVYPDIRESIARDADKFLAEWPSTAEIYLPDGKVPPIGYRLKTTAWANTFKRILDVEARNAHRGRQEAIRAALDFFYRGPIAEEMARFAQSTRVRDASGHAHAGLLEFDDLANYKSTIERPVTFNYRGIDVYKCSTWNQGPVLLQQLALLEGYDLVKMGHNSAEFIHTVVEASKLAFADREAYYGDPAFVDVPLDRLLSREYAERRRQLIDPARASTQLRPGDAPASQPRRVTGDPRVYVGDTTHIDAVDERGTLFSATPSGGWIPSSPVIPSLGFPLGTRGQQFYLAPDHPNSLQPGKRPRTTLTPSLAMKDGRPYMAFGTPGGDGQDQWSLQFFVNYVDFGMDLQEAIDAPNFHSRHFPSSFYPHGAEPNRLTIETRVPEGVRAELAARGHDVRVGNEWSGGEVSAIRYNPDTGIIAGAASPRRMAAYVVGL